MLSKYFLSKDGSAPLEKTDPCAYGSPSRVQGCTPAKKTGFGAWKNTSDGEKIIYLWHIFNHIHILL